MSARSIPAELEPVIADLVKQKKSTPYICEWLKEQHGLNPSPMAVHRLAERIRLLSDEPVDLEAELEAARQSEPYMLRNLELLAYEFGRLAHDANEGDREKGIEPNPAEAKQLAAKHGQFVRAWFRTKAQLERALEHRKKSTQPSASNRPDPAQRQASLDRQAKMKEVEAQLAKTLRRAESTVDGAAGVL